MRRLLSILLVCLFGLPLVTPLLALGQTPESRLPACCRKGGDHQCMGGMAQTDTSGPQTSPNPRFGLLTVRCPYTPGTVAVSHLDLMFTPNLPVAFVSPIAQPFVARLNASMRRIATDRSCPKRGPPSLA